MRRLVAPLALGALLLAAPAPAGAAQVGPQVERSSPSRFPEEIPGCRPGCRRGREIPRGWVLLSRRVRLEPRERRVRTAFACPPRRVLRTFGQLQSGDVFIQVPADQVGYRGRTRARVIGERGLAPSSRPAAGTLYAVCVPR